MVKNDQKWPRILPVVKVIIVKTNRLTHTHTHTHTQTHTHTYTHTTLFHYDVIILHIFQSDKVT